MIFIKLFLAHLIGDFLLQPDSWVREKEQKKIRSSRLLFHALIHFGLMMLLVWDAALLPMILLITALHIAMDILKLYAQNENTRRRWFFIDQVVHVSVLVVVSLLVTAPETIQLQLERVTDNPAIWLIATGVVFLTFPAAIIIKMSISKWSVAIEQESSARGQQADGSLARAGQVIGILERLFVYGLMLAGQWQAIGFLLAAKSVFRFGDLRELRDRKLTEYVLIGTLLSFGIALLTGLVTSLFLT